MKSVRVLLGVVALLAVLIPAVFLRSGGALADADPPTKEEITRQCIQEITDFAMYALLMQQSGVAVDDFLGTLPPGIPAPLIPMIKALYAKDDAAAQAAADKSLVDCIAFYTKKTARRT